ncbi:MAG: AMP-binding protein, partial [Blastocatellia bacterium]
FVPVMQDYNLLVTDQRYRDTVRFWRERLATVNGGFRWDPVRSIESSVARSSIEFALSDRANLVIDRFAKDEIGRLAVTAAAIACVLSRHVQQSPVIVRTPSLDSSAMGSGAFTVPLIIEVLEDWTVSAFLRETAGALGETYSLDDFPLDTFMHRDYKLDSRSMTNLALSDDRVHGPCRQFPDAAVLIRLNCAGDGANEVCYDPGGIEQFVVEGLAAHIVRVLEQFDEPARKLADLDLLSKEERSQLLTDFNSTAASRSPGTAVCLFEAQVRRSPDCPAVVHKDLWVTYARLNARANQLARHLIEEVGLGTGQCVGIILDRSPGMVCAVLAALKAGSAYVPIDPGYPAARISYTLTDAKVTALISSSEYIQSIAGFSGYVFAVDLQLDTVSQSGEDLESKPWPQDAAYIIYTSGST